eukprot:CAMPEP_0178958800 /NCGR_PEP_ID=MMETSP0789-20121207/11862_1 /TAXON_ID=3005 /ORGANISM="Rhizosolenia setigera, Strain CCMP 1694" /LENGTH=969 /DNA_ID=CAMNT_0020641583 /DNA_START=170 /DNA_END=3079 /DNA_ORIENTATION=-
MRLSYALFVAYGLTSLIDNRSDAFSIPSLTSTTKIQHLQKQRTTTLNLMSLNNNNEDPNDNDIDSEFQLQHEQKNQRQRLRRAITSVSLAFFTASTALSSPFNNILPQNANAMGPNLLAPRLPEKAKSGEALEKELAQKALRSQYLRDNAKFEQEASRIFKEKGPDAHAEFIKNHQKEQLEASQKKKVERKELIEKLLFEQGIDPFVSNRGKAILFQFDYGVDLYQHQGTSQTNFEELKRIDPQKYGNLENLLQKKTVERIAELKEEGKTPEEIVAIFKSDSEVVVTERQQMEQQFDRMKARREAYRKELQEKKRKKQFEKSKQNEPVELKETEEKLRKDNQEEQLKKEEEEKVAETTHQAEEATLKAKITATKAKEARKKAKEEQNALKQKEKAELKKQQAEQKALKQKQKIESAEKKAAEKAAKLAAAAAGVGAATFGTASTSVAGSVASSSIDVATSTATSEIVADTESAVTSTSTEETSSSEETASQTDVAASSEEESQILSTPPSKIPAKKITSVAAVIGGGGVAFKFMKDKQEEDVKEKERQFKLIMGLSEDTDNKPDDVTTAPGGSTFLDLPDDPTSTPDVSAPTKSTTETDSSTPAAAEEIAPKKKKGGLNFFKKSSSSSRATDLSELMSSDAISPEFSMLIAKFCSYGAPGRFPQVSVEGEFDLDKANEEITETKKKLGLTDTIAAELFASVVNCMIIDIIDLASSSLSMKTTKKKKKGKKKGDAEDDEDASKDKMTVDALNVVLDFMDHAASLFDAVAGSTVIQPVVYEGSLKKAKLEKMFSIYAGQLMSSMMDLDSGVSQERLDVLQQVFDISDKKAEGIAQRVMMKNLMKVMKEGGSGEGGGMEGLAEMMGGLGGGDMSALEGMMGGGMPGFGDPNAELSPEEIKQSVTMMKELVNSGQISSEEIKLVKEQFKQAYGQDIEDLIKAADGADGDELGEDGKELLDLFKTVLKEDDKEN